jgi:hypothetical protein
MGVSAIGDKFQAERKAIDDSINALNTLPYVSDQNSEQQTSYDLYFSNLQNAIQNQYIIADQSAGMTSGGFFNPGLGILQLILTKNLRIPIAGTMDAYTPFGSDHVAYITKDPQSWNYADPSFDLNVINTISPFIYNHVASGRIEVYINGIQNTPDEVDRSAQALQVQIDKVLHPNGSGPHTPVISQYNVSSKLYYGAIWSQHDPLDLGDCITNKEDCVNYDSVTTNQDSIRLMATLNALFRVIWDRSYQIYFYLKNCSSFLPSCYWKVMKINYSVDAHLTNDLLEMSNPFGELQDDRYWFVPKYHSTFNDDYPTGDNQLTNICNADSVFTQQMQNEITRLYSSLSNMPVTLHAHSQGAIISAVVQSRLGLLVNATRESPNGEVQSVVDLAKQIDLVTYGGAANMYDWGPTQRYKSYTHHVNKNDLVALLGMNDPFQLTLRPMLKGPSAAGDEYQKLLGWLPGICLIPPKALFDAWTSFHKVIYHSSKAWGPNITEHNMTNGYVGNIMSNPSTLTPTLFPNKFNGKPRCIDQ